MKAIIFAAGLGTRIQEVSKGKPKALVKLGTKTLLLRAVEFLAKSGVEAVVVNIHHQAELMKTYITQTHFPIPVSISDESKKLLDTGGALLKARSFFAGEQHFLAFNVDVISNIDIQKMLEYHIQTEALATLAVRNRSTSRYLLFDAKNRMLGWENLKTNERILHSDVGYHQLAFSGIQMLSTKIFDALTKTLEKTSEEKFSITKSYINLSKENLIQAYLHNQDYWFDVGKPESYMEASDFLKKHALLDY